jgi:hypothetical protein
LRQLAGDPESSHPNSAMSICRDWKVAAAFASANDESDVIWREFRGAAAHADPAAFLALRLS